MLSRAAAIFALLVLALGAAACGAQTGAESLDVEDPWVRSASQGDVSAGYMVLQNAGPEAATLDSVVTALAEAVEIHESRHENDVMIMEHIHTLTVPAGESVTLEPGGYHLMLLNLTEDLVAGDTVALTLSFADGRSFTVDAEVR